MSSEERDRKLKNTFVNTEVYVDGEYVGIIKDVSLEAGIMKAEKNHWIVTRPILHLTMKIQDDEDVKS